VGYPGSRRKPGVKLKLDENLSRRAADLIRAAGHDAITVADQGLRGAPDEALFEACKHEGRALVTLDRDFSQVLRYPPAATAGIVILELGPHTQPSSIEYRNSCASLRLGRRNGRCGSSSPGACAFISRRTIVNDYGAKCARTGQRSSVRAILTAHF